MSRELGVAAGSGRLQREAIHEPTKRTINILSWLLGSVTAACSILFSILLLYVYASYVTVQFAYMGHEWTPNLPGIVTGTLLVAVVALLLPTKLHRASDILVYIMFIMAFLPGMVIPSAFSPLLINKILTYQIVLAACFVLLLLVNRAPMVRTHLKILTPHGYRVMLVTLWAIMMVPIVYYMGVPKSIPGFGEVYGVRFQARESIAAAPAIVAFVYTMMATVVSKVLFVYGLVYKRSLIMLAGLGTSVYLYSLSGHKSYLFQLALLVMIVVALAVFRGWVVRLIVPASVVLIILSLSGDALLGSDWLKSLLIRRTFIVPGILTGYYQEYFLLNPQAEWAYSFLGFLGSSSYDATPPFLVGEHYFNNPATSANANIWSDGFANFRYAGMVVATLVAASTMWLVNSLALGKSPAFTASLTTTVLMTFVSSSVFTSLLTHGGLLLLILIALCPEQGGNSGGVADTLTPDAHESDSTHERPTVSMTAR